MEEKTCENCGRKYDSSLNLCPYCSTNSNNLSDYNIRNPFLEMENNKQNEFTRSDLPPKEDLSIPEETTLPLEKNNNDILFSNKNSIIQEEPNSIITKSNGQNIDPERLKNLHNPAFDFGDNLEETRKREEKKKKKEEIIANQSPKTNKKKSNLLANDFLVLMFWSLAVTIFVTVYDFNIVNFCHYVAIILLHIIGYKLAVNNKRIAGLIGIIVAICMILTILENDIIDMLIGIFILMHSIIYLVKFEKK